MLRTRFGRLALGVLSVVALSVASVAVVSAANNGGTKGIHDLRTSATEDCINATTGADEGDFTYDGPLVAWPPNHKVRYGSITLTEDDDADMLDDVTLVVTATHDQVVDGEEVNGSGHTPLESDATGGTDTGTGSATVPISFRGERSGRRKEGRTYTFDTTGSSVDTMTSECEPVQFEAWVPHDMRDHPLG